MMAFSNQIIGGHYKILRQLGKGGFGVTYLAEDLHRLETLCVIKQLTYKSQNPNELKKAQELFEREAKILIKLGNHEQIPYLIGYFSEESEFYLVQEYIEGDSFAEELYAQKKLEEEDIISFLLEILNILKYVHDNRVIHRDIKPPNIMRRQKDKKLVLIDFGSVKEAISQTESPQIPTPTRIFTDGYTPREQVNGSPQFNSDIYALGMTAIRALTGIEPKDLEQDKDTGMRQWRKKAPHVSQKLAQIVDTMIQEDYEYRYQSVEEIIEDLQDVKTLMVVGHSGNTPTNALSSVVSLRIPFINVSLGLALMILAPLLIITAFASQFKISTSQPQATPSTTPTPSLSPTPSRVSTPTPENPQEGENSQKGAGIFLRPDSLKDQ